MIKRYRMRVDIFEAESFREITNLINKALNYRIDHHEELSYAEANNDIINIIENNVNDDYYEIVVYYKVKDD